MDNRKWKKWVQWIIAENFPQKIIVNQEVFYCRLLWHKTYEFYLMDNNNVGTFLSQVEVTNSEPHWTIYKKMADEVGVQRGWSQT